MNPTIYSTRLLPDELAGLAELALDLRWSWDHSADVLWQAMDPKMWEAHRNPWFLLAGATPRRLGELAADRRFCAELAELLQRRRALEAEPTWFARSAGSAAPASVAFFSMEFALTEALPIYSGGLGIIAGDYLKAASDLGVPLVGVGLLCQQGSFRQALDVTGSQLEVSPLNDPAMLPILPLTDEQGAWLRVSVDLPGRSVKLRCWTAQVGSIPLYLLDSNVPENAAGDRGLTGKLYGNGIENRLQQEMLLGIGGWRMLQSLKRAPEICHLNEAHGAFALLERARNFMSDTGVIFGAALAATRAGNIFTCHTPVPSGFDRFPDELMIPYFRAYAAQLDTDLEELLELGRAEGSGESRPFNMGYLAARGSARILAISARHEINSRGLFEPLFRRWPAYEFPIQHIDVGIHFPSWASPAAAELWTILSGNDQCHLDPDKIRSNLARAGDGTLWALRCVQRKALIESLDRRLARQAALHGRETTGRSLDPDILTLVIAHPFTSFRRPHLLLFDPERLMRMLTHPERPVQLVVSGKAHPKDKEGKLMVRAWAHYMSRPDVCGRMIYLEDYDLMLAHELVQGADLWINMPRISTEASGTSGMKILINGGLNLAKLDGWWAESFAQELGWAIGNGQTLDTATAWDAIESVHLFNLLESEVIPAFYDRDPDGIPRAWVSRMRESMARLTARYSSCRMLKDYLEQCYLPCARDYQTRSALRGLLAKNIHTWRQTIERAWPTLRFGHFSVQTEGEVHEFSVEVDLAGLKPEMVAVEMYAEAPLGGAPLRHEMLVQKDPAAAGGPFHLYKAAVPACRPARDYTPRVIPYHDSAAIPLEAAHSLWLR